MGLVEALVNLITKRHDSINDEKLKEEIREVIGISIRISIGISGK